MTRVRFNCMAALQGSHDILLLGLPTPPSEWKGQVDL